MSDDIESQTGNVIPLRQTPPSREGWSEAEQDALELARLGAMDVIEYERSRIAAARKLKMRPSILDRLVRNIWGMRRPIPSEQAQPLPVGHPIRFHYTDNRSVMSFVVQADFRYEEHSHLLVLADGKGTAVWGVRKN